MRIKRRDFLKLAGTIGAGAVISIYTSDIQSIFAQVTQGQKHAIWLQGASDTGCTISLLQGVNPDLVDVINRFRLSVDFQPNLMISSGDAAIGSLQDAVNGLTPLDVLIVEGAVPKASYCTVGEIAGTPVPFETWVQKLGARARHVVAVGTCAAFGGIPAAVPNPTTCRSVTQVLPYKRVVNIPGCPAHPDWVTLTLASVFSGTIPRLDEHGRPEAFFDEEVHEECPLKPYYERDLFVSYPSERGKCLYSIGCRGPETHGDCPTRLWNNRTGFCTAGLWRNGAEVYPAGAPCIGCTEPGFPDPPFSPFYVREQEEDEGEEESSREERTSWSVEEDD